jgi:hypothetical protein
VSWKSDDRSMTREELRAWLLTENGFAFFRQTVVDHYAWFIHEAPFRYVDDIRRNGQYPRQPFCGLPQSVRDAVQNVSGIVCLNPVGSQPAGASDTGELFRVGLRAADLPERVGLDWSYSDSWALRNISETQIGSLGKQGALLSVVNDTGSVVSYLPLQPSVLRVCTHGKHGTFPSTWPMLAEVQNDQIVSFRRN